MKNKVYTLYIVSSNERHCPRNRYEPNNLVYVRNPSDLSMSIPELSLPMTGNWNLTGSGFILEGASYLSWTVRFDTAPVIRFMFSM